MDAPEAEALSLMSLWYLRYLRDLDNSGFIDGWYASRPGHGGGLLYGSVLTCPNPRA